MRVVENTLLEIMMSEREVPWYLDATINDQRSLLQDFGNFAIQRVHEKVNLVANGEANMDEISTASIV